MGQVIKSKMKQEIKSKMDHKMKHEIGKSKVDYKKEYKDLYMPKGTPCVIEVPEIPFVMVKGKGNPNDEDGEYQKAVELLYAISYTIKMSKKGNDTPLGYFDYIVPPLEGMWWMSDHKPGVDYKNKGEFCWISMIRLPEFVTEEVFQWACEEVQRRKKLNTSRAEFKLLKEGMCIQCMHIGPFDNEPLTLEKMETYITENGYINDVTETRHHHEIYLSDPRKGDINKMKTILRIPVRSK